jgi:hypothetical protein
VGLVETHISLVFFAGERVYKVKKPVDLGFLDYTALAARKHYCEEEVRLNRRLAPGVYLGVVPIVRSPEGLLVGPEAAPAGAETVEWAVEMVRLPEQRMLAALLDRGEVDNELLNRLCALLVRFHAEAATGAGVDEHGTVAAITANAEENFEQARPFVGTPAEPPPGGVRTLSPSLHAFLAARARAFLGAERVLLLRRVAAGRIREGHGDLHAGNVCCTETGLVAYDCIEFNRRFRCADVACDLAFLAMDLDARGFTGFAGYLVHAYARAADDRDLARLMPFYKAYRAVVRGKVGSMAAAGMEPGPAREERRLEAMRYFQLAACYDLPRALILTCGLPATGKSWVAKAFARPLHAVLLRSDVRRKLLSGIPLTRHAEQGAYSAERTEQTYRALLEDATAALRSGRSAIVDATFSSASLRAPFVDAAARMDVPYWIVHLTAPEAIVRERMARRATEPGEVSDADFSVYERARTTFEPPDEVTRARVLAIESGADPSEESSALLIDRMIAASSVAHELS